VKNRIISERRIGGLIAIFFGILSINEAYSLYRQYGNQLLAGDHTFPALIGILLVVVGFSLFFDRARNQSKAVFPSKQILLRSSAVIALLFIYCLLMKWVGYLVSTLVISVIIIKFIGQYHLFLSVIIGCILTAALYFLFVIFLNTPFPRGTLF
jgi:hypothetical protein